MEERSSEAARRTFSSTVQVSVMGINAEPRVARTNCFDRIDEKMVLNYSHIRIVSALSEERR